MKLKDLFKSKEKKQLEKEREDRLNQGLRPMKKGYNMDNSIEKGQAKEIGDGIQSIAYSHKKHPGSVIKDIRLDDPIKYEPVIIFHKMAMKQHENNPYFPKVYKMIPYRKKGKRGVFVNMEKLHDGFSSKAQDLFKAQLRRVGLDHYVDNYKSLHDASDAFHNDMQTAGSRSKVLSSITDHKFKEALVTLEKLFSQYGSDMHFGNILIRLSGAGSQLVLIDPFSPTSSALRAI